MAVIIIVFLLLVLLIVVIITYKDKDVQKIKPIESQNLHSNDIYDYFETDDERNERLAKEWDDDRIEQVAETFKRFSNYEKNIKLTIELVPKTSWFSNVRSNVSDKEWDTIRRAAYKKANYRCEICGGKGTRHPVECHEIWEYNDKKNIQKLVRTIALCPNCHKVKHIGLNGRDENIEWLAKVNKWDIDTANDYVDYVFSVWKTRSWKEWTLDLSWIKQEFGDSVQIKSAV